MALEVTHISTTVRERGASSVSAIGGRALDGSYWQQTAETTPAEAYYVMAGGHRIPVERLENPELGYHYFVAAGREEGNNLLLLLPTLPHGP